MKRLIDRWNAETPKLAKLARNIFASLSVAVPAAWASVKAMDITVSDKSAQVVAAVTFISVLVTVISQLQTTQKNKK